MRATAHKLSIAKIVAELRRHALAVVRAVLR